MFGLNLLSGIKSGVEIAGLNLFIIILIFILGVLGIILSIWSGVALFYAVANETLKMKEAFQKARERKITSFIWIGLLTTLVEFGGFILGIIPGIIFAIWFIISQFVFIVEGKKGFSALLRSKEYISGRWKKSVLANICLWTSCYSCWFS